MSNSSINVKPRIVRTHLALYVKDPEASARWYEDVLDMEVTAREARWVFMSFGKKHHDIALIKADPAIDAGSDVAAWPRTLDRVLALGGRDAVYVPGHGAVVDADFVLRQRDWLAARR